jgi:RNA polymerase sigma-70 factor (ECF subfamily)
LDTVRYIDRLESWIYQIARNCIMDYYRSRRRIVPLGELGDEEGYSEAAAPAMDLSARDLVAPDAFDEDISQNLARDIHEIVQALPEPYREALILTEYQGLTQKEMAERLGISLSGAKSRVQRARQKVKDALMTCCHFEFDARGLVYDYCQRCCCCESEKTGAC